MTLSVDAAFKGKRVLITGTTGFIGKVLLEKLMRDVPGIAGFVLLLRGNRAHPDAQRRFHAEVLSASVFEPLRRSDALALHEAVERKLRVIDGEITQPEFGLSAADFHQLSTEVDVIINVAASVNFREELDQALAINALSLRHLAKLARDAGGIPLVQVSTCYVNGHHRGVIAEEIAPPARAKLPRHADGAFEVDALLDRLQGEIAAVNRRALPPAVRARTLVELGIREARAHGWNDTYTFTKWLGEQIACREMRGGSLSIVRPAIVESACREPQPGWIEGLKVGDAIVLAYARGKTTLFPARTRGVADIIPVDLVANSIILASAEALLRRGQRRIYQASSSVRNPVSVGDYIRLCQSEMRDNAAAYPRLIRRPLNKRFRTVPRALFIAWLVTAHALAGAMNRAARALGAARNLAVYDALQTTRELAVVFSFYTAPRYVFDNGKLMALADAFDEIDRWRFEVDPRCYDWAHYVARVHLPGLERFAVRGPRDDVPQQTTAVALPEGALGA